MDHLYIITYDISDQRRWRRVYRTLKGYGVWVQLSIFQCRLTKKRAILLESILSEIVNHSEDHVLLMDLGPVETIKPKVNSIGRVFRPVEIEPVIV